MPVRCYIVLTLYMPIFWEYLDNANNYPDCKYDDYFFGYSNFLKMTQKIKKMKKEYRN